MLTAVPGGLSDSPQPHHQKGAQTVLRQPTVTQCSTLLRASSVHRPGTTGGFAFQYREANPRRYYLRFPGGHEAPDLVSLFYFFFRSCVASCRACLPSLTVCSNVAAATCQRSNSNPAKAKQRASFFLLWRRNSTSRYSMPLPVFGLAVRRAARVSLPVSSANLFLSGSPIHFLSSASLLCRS